MTAEALLQGAASHRAPAGPGAADSPVLLGLIGSPIAHSASPAMHEAAARGTGFAAHYQLIEVAGASRQTLEIILAGLRQKKFAGVNVTFPYKELVVPLLDGLSAAARAIGTVNAVVIGEGGLIGHNTDATGFASAFRAVFGTVAPRSVALIGAGGVGRAIAFALAELGASQLRILDRDHDKAKALAGALAGRLPAYAVTEPRAALTGADGLVNGTPSGMLPDRSSPIPAALLHGGLWVADAVYSPLWTPLLILARDCGAKLMTGRELCVYQARDAFRLFTGIEPDARLMADAFDEVMRLRTLPKNDRAT